MRLPTLNPIIGGKAVDCAERFSVLDKYTQRTIAEVGETSEMHVEDAVAAALTALRRGAPPPYDMARILERTAAILLRERSRIIDVMISETGFTEADAETEIDRAAIVLKLCAEEATRIVGDTVSFAATPGQHRRLGFTLRFPVGVVCAITPFNSPLYTVSHKVAPALAAGNPVILKPSELTPLTAAFLCEALLEAGLPDDFIALLQGSGDRVGRFLVANNDIAFYSFTGSTRVGRLIQQGAGLRRTQMELGSIASTIVCADADLSVAIPKIASAGFRKAGQVCVSVQRLYVEQPIFDDFMDMFTEAALKMPLGNPRLPETRVGPMITLAAAERAAEWIEEARLGQALIKTGGGRSGAMFEPTIVTGVRPGMRVVDSEIFAPCVVVMPFTSFDDMILDANNTPFGLSAGIFTNDLSRTLEAGQKLRFGAIHVNETSSARADAMPFGGVKDSGFGHEGPKYAIRELTEERLITFNN
ncbi:aldehyde dehydrogenase [Bradyrhizobium sp. LTSP885]|nr:aldehyde dehydrogenase [Bradyrhizobium sp. LTSP885]